MSGFFKAYLGWPTYVVLAGMAIYLLQSPAGNPYYWADDALGAALALVLSIEAWLVPYIVIPAAFMASEALPWNRHTGYTHQGENMLSVTVGVIVSAVFTGAFYYAGMMPGSGIQDPVTFFLTAMAVGLIGPAIWFAVIFIWIAFPGELK